MTFEERILCGNPLQRFGSGLEPDPELTRKFGPVANTTQIIYLFIPICCSCSSLFGHYQTNFSSSPLVIRAPHYQDSGRLNKGDVFISRCRASRCLNNVFICNWSRLPHPLVGGLWTPATIPFLYILHLIANNSDWILISIIILVIDFFFNRSEWRRIWGNNSDNVA